jgi:hypothetical protein
MIKKASSHKPKAARQDRCAAVINSFPDRSEIEYWVIGS